jgi:hypothetical protein
MAGSLIAALVGSHEEKSRHNIPIAGSDFAAAQSRADEMILSASRQFDGAGQRERREARSRCRCYYFSNGMYC